MEPTYLTASFRDREQVKALGARWDAERRQWYVPTGRDLAPFSAWLPTGAAPASTAIAPLAPPTTDVALAPKGVSLSALLSGVARAVAQAHAAGVWTRVEVLKVDSRRGHVSLELTERDIQGDAVAQARAVIWADTANTIVPAFERATGAVLGPGIKLLVRAKPTFNALYGLSLVIDAIDPDYTLGDLEAKKREIRTRLQREGLFDSNRRLAPPWDYRAVLVVAPEGAAGLGDFQAEAQRIEQAGICRFTYVHSRFQGEGAAGQVLKAMLDGLAALAKDAGSPDAVVIIRGGGAVNDLAWLNDYALARAICELEVPVLTGIGHERDSTVLDEVAHQAFDTPSKVIGGIEQVIVRRVKEVKASFEQVAQIASRTLQAATRSIEQADTAVKQGAQRQLTQSKERSAQWMDGMRIAAMQSVRQGSEAAREQFFAIQAGSRQTLQAGNLEAQRHFAGVLELGGAATRRVAEGIERHRQEVESQARRLLVDAAAQTEAMVREIAGQGPHKTLGRGFAIVRGPDGETITSAQAGPTSGMLSIEFHDGRIAVQPLPLEKPTP